jgi:hypothetical protein
LDDIQQCKFISCGWITFIHQISCHHINSFYIQQKIFLGRPVNTHRDKAKVNSNPFADSDVQKMINSTLGTFHDSCKDDCKRTNAMALACTDGTLELHMCVVLFHENMCSQRVPNLINYIFSMTVSQQQETRPYIRCFLLGCCDHSTHSSQMEGGSKKKSDRSLNVVE